MVERVAVALGASLGDVAATLGRAIEALGALRATTLLAGSPLQDTAPVGPATSRFLNAACLLETTLTPFELGEELARIETLLGRTRAQRWSDRALDLDLLFYGQWVIATDRLRVPHPACFYRRFVLDPLVTIAPDLWHPQQETTVSQLRERLLGRPLAVALTGLGAEQAGCDLAPRFPNTQLLAATEPGAMRLFRTGAVAFVVSIDCDRLIDAEVSAGNGGVNDTADFVALVPHRPGWIDPWRDQTTRLPRPWTYQATLDRVAEILAAALGEE
jgi:2-amino-4-hydroxy-6-hydroxymethyldihydropteridine diphosphokinase